MANINFPRGLQPYGNLLQVTEYTLASGLAQDLFIWDPVVVLGTDRNVTIATAGTGNAISGVIVGIYDLDKVPLQTWESGHTGIGFLLVADDPRQLFIAQGDGAVSFLDIDDSNGNVNLVAGAGSTVNFLSGWEINDSDTGGSTANDQIRLIRPNQVEENTVGIANADWLFRINNHTANAGIVGVGV
jgi:hypothetical protein